MRLTRWRPDMTARGGASDLPVGPPPRKPSSTSDKNNPLAGFRKSEVECRVPIRTEGRTRRHEPWIGMRWARVSTSDECAPRARQRRVVLTPIKPGPRGERAISRNAIAQGRPECPAEPVVPSPCFFIARGPWVSADTRPSLRPRFRGPPNEAQPGRQAPRDGRRAS
jgi:hypothetical protein